MLQLARSLSPAALRDLAALEREVVAADGGRLKLEWSTLRSRPGDRVCDLLWYDGSRLVGFLGRYAFGPVAELAGMVAPDARRRGTGGALLDGALQLCADRGDSRALLVVPRGSAGGARLAASRGGVLDHSEHALALPGAPPPTPEDPATTLRRATPDDAPAVTDLLHAAFGWPPHDLVAQLADDREPTHVVERDGAPVGTVRTALVDGVGSVYGLAVAPAVQGRGVGRDVLARVCRRLRADGATRVTLEVAVDNPRALGLYTSLGFTPVTTEDYYALDVPRPDARSQASPRNGSTSGTNP